MTSRSSSALALAALAVSGLLVLHACGGSDGGGGKRVTLRGNVFSTVLASLPRPAGRPASRFAARPRLDALGEMLLPSAHAACAADVQDVLACATSVRDANGNGSLERSEITLNCVPVNVDTCEFNVAIRLGKGADVDLAFVQDENGNGSIDGGEPLATFANPPEFAVCNGDVIVVSNVAISFRSETFAATSSEKAVDACAAGPTPTATSVPTM